MCESFQLSKDSGFKVVSHMMPDLPNVGLERDIEQFIVSDVRIYLQSEYIEKYQSELCSKYDREYDFDVLLG